MSRNVAYLFCRYSISDSRARELSLDEQLRAFKALRGVPVVHRKAEPTDNDRDTLICRPKSSTVEGYGYIIFDVAQEVTGRSVADYDRDADAIVERWDDGKHIRYTSFVAIPQLGVVATSDRSGDPHLGATPAIARLRSVFRNQDKIPGVALDIVAAADRVEVKRALTEWALNRFSFSVRPFNPHPRIPGKKLSEMMKQDQIGAVRGVATPTPGGQMSMSSEGYIEEAVGLADAGYGQYGFDGTTPSGRQASLKKPNFSLDKAKNERVQSAPQQIKVSLDPQPSEAEEFKEAARALIEFYG